MRNIGASRQSWPHNYVFEESGRRPPTHDFLVTPLVYSVPRFLSRTIDYPSDAFPPLTTAPTHLAQHFFETNPIDSFVLNVNEVILPSLHRFTHDKSLHVSGSSLLPLDLLQSIVHLHHIESLDVSNILRCSPDMLIDSACHLSQLKMKFDPLFRIPSEISSLILDNNDRLIPIDIISHQISSVRTLQIDVKIEGNDHWYYWPTWSSRLRLSEFRWVCVNDKL
jgi:hypothetical protein